MGQVMIDFCPRAFVDRYDISEDDKQLLVDELFEGNANWVLSDWGMIDETEVARRAFPRIPRRMHDIAMDAAVNWSVPIIPIDGAADMVRAIKGAGYGLYLLSNAGYTHREYWPTVPGSEYFDGVVVSAYEKLLKPDPAIYRRLLERFGLRAEECIFTDDRQVNLAGAETVGIKSVLFRSPEDFLRKIADLNICI